MHARGKIAELEGREEEARRLAGKPYTLKPKT
jgi:hypothetical protein